MQGKSSTLTHQEFAEEDIKAYERVRSHTAPYTTPAFGIDLIIYPNVFSPHYFTDSIWFAEKVAKHTAGKRLLEIGTGTGIVALKAGLDGASGVATDINPAAVENARLNFETHKVNFEVRLGHLFTPIQPLEKFDVVFWNHPFFNVRHFDDLLLSAGFDFQYRNLRAYLNQAHGYLTTEGEVLLGTGNAADLNMIESLCAESHRQLQLLDIEEVPVHPGSSIMNDYRVYKVF